MDEPFGAVDPVVRQRLQDEFRRLQDELGKTVVLVTHDIDEALRLGDRLAVLATGGRLEQYGTPAEVLARPATPFVADFVGAGRALRRLDLLSAADALAAPSEGLGSEGPAVAPEATLAEVMSALLAGDAPAVRVVDTGRTLGLVTLESIRSALRREDSQAVVEAEGLADPAASGSDGPVP
jgi:osmoprotectant transport system ATP-binding protein